MSHLLDWSQAFAAGATIAGGKGWNLARLDRYGFPVPRGAVLSAQACRDFMAANGSDFLNGALPESLVADIRDGLARLGLDRVCVAVRSSGIAEDSAQASFAGIHESVLNLCSLATILQAIRQCWASAFSERALAYRQRLGLGVDDCAPAVVIMEMVKPESAGVAFSLDPRTGREDCVAISANFGLGESVVGGHADPDEFLVEVGFHAPDARIVETRLGRKEARSVAEPAGGTALVPALGKAGQPSLPAAQALRLARLVVRVRDALGRGETHQDVEWAWDGQDVWLLQARPVTARPRHAYAGLADQPDIWSNGNIRDSMPMVIRPLVWSLSPHVVQTILEAPHRAAGWAMRPGLTRFRQIGGRGYLNASLMQWEFLDGFGVPAELSNRFMGGHQPEITPALTTGWRHKLRRLGANLRLIRAVMRARKAADGEFAAARDLADRLRALARPDTPDAELTEAVAQSLREYAKLPALHLVHSVSAGTYLMLSGLLNRHCPGQGEALAQALLIDAGAITSAEHGLRLGKLAELAAAEPEAVALLRNAGRPPQAWRDLPEDSAFRRAFAAFLDEFGHRGVYELDFQNPRWNEDSTWLLDNIRDLLDADARADLDNRRRATRDRAWDTIRARVPFWLHGLIRRMARQAGTEAGQREMAKSTVVRVGSANRVILLELARRLAERGIVEQPDDIFFLTFEDLRDLAEGLWDGKGARALVSDRRAHDARLAAETPPDLVIDGHAAPAPAAAPQPAEGRLRLTGMAVAAGRADGSARLIATPHDGARLAQGDILVAPSTDPGWTPLFLRAAALVTETGGFISHGAIVAREFGIPAVVNVPGVLNLLADGQRIGVDGDRGLVEYEA